MFIYLASPYTNNPEENFKLAESYVAQQLKNGVCIFSPIVHCHEIAQKHDLPHDFNFWQNYNFNMLFNADELWILKIPGWENSVGVQEEIKFAEKHKLKVKYIEL